jgi:hypothetical protein
MSSIYRDVPSPWNLLCRGEQSGPRKNSTPSLGFPTDALHHHQPSNVSLFHFAITSPIPTVASRCESPSSPCPSSESSSSKLLCCGNAQVTGTSPSASLGKSLSTSTKQTDVSGGNLVWSCCAKACIPLRSTETTGQWDLKLFSLRQAWMKGSRLAGFDPRWVIRVKLAKK